MFKYYHQKNQHVMIFGTLHTKCMCCFTDLMLEENPLDEQGSDVLLFPVKLQRERRHTYNHPAGDSLKLTTISSFVALLQLTLFSIDFLTRVKLFQRDSNSLLCVPRKNTRSLMICRRTHRKRTRETFAGPTQDKIITSHT